MAIVESNNAAPSVPAKAPAKSVRVVEDHGPLAHLLDTARFEHLQRIAIAMAGASLIPDHLRGRSNQETVGNCFLVVNQSLRWGMDPFAVAPETYSVGGKLGYQGKLVAALVNTRANLIGRLRYEFKGKGEDRTVTVIGRFEDEDQDRTVDLSVAQAKTANKMWANDPDQKLIYSASTKWARRHCPEVLLGVLTDDDLDRMIETRQIVDGPTTEINTLADLTAHLNGGDKGETSGEVPAQGGELPAQSSSASEPAPVEKDWPAIANGFREAARSLHAVGDVNRLASETIEAHPDMPEESAARIRGLAEMRVVEIRAARGEGSNKQEQKTLG